MSKRYKKLPKDSKELSAVTIDKILNIIKANCTAKFDESFGSFLNLFDDINL